MFETFHNRTLHFITLELEPYAVLHDNGTWTGMAIDLINYISEMLNFSYTIHIQKDGIWGIDTGNMTYSGMIGRIQRGEYDMGLNAFSQTADRSRVVDFCQPFIFADYYLMIKRPPATDTFFMVYPFTNYTWFGIISTTLAIMLFLAFVSYCHGHTIRFAVSTESSDWPSLWTTWKPVVAQAVDPRRPVTLSQQVTLATWWLTAVILVGTYNSSLTSSLAVRKIRLPVNDVEELAKSSLPVVIPRNTAIHGILATAKDDVMKRLYEKVLETDGFVDVYGRIVDVVLDNPNTVSLFDGDAFNSLQRMRPDLPEVKCKLSIIARMNRVQHGFVFPKNSPYRDAISRSLLLLMEVGIYDRILKKYQDREQCNGFERRDVQRPLGLDVVCGVFYLLAGGLLVSALCLALELYVWHKGRDPAQCRKTKADIGFG